MSGELRAAAVRSLRTMVLAALATVVLTFVEPNLYSAVLRMPPPPTRAELARTAPGAATPPCVRVRVARCVYTGVR